MKKLILGIILLVICTGLIIYNEVVDSKYQVNIHDITSSGAKEENIKVYLDATFVAGTIKDNYYVIFGDGVQYIVYMEKDRADKINNYLLDNPNNSYRIKGVTKLIPSMMEEDGKKFVKKWLDNNHNHDGEDETHSHDIETDEFYHYFGYVYLDSTINNNPLKIITYIVGITGILFILYFINNKYKFI